MLRAHPRARSRGCRVPSFDASCHLRANGLNVVALAIPASSGAGNCSTAIPLCLPGSGGNTPGREPAAIRIACGNLPHVPRHHAVRAPGRTAGTADGGGAGAVRHRSATRAPRSARSAPPRRSTPAISTSRSPTGKTCSTPSTSASSTTSSPRCAPTRPREDHARRPRRARGCGPPGPPSPRTGARPGSWRLEAVGVSERLERQRHETRQALAQLTADNAMAAGGQRHPAPARPGADRALPDGRRGRDLARMDQR